MSRSARLLDLIQALRCRRTATTASLGLWSRHTVEPAAMASGGAAELAFMADDVDAVRADWLARGLPVIQPPTDMDFGRCFTAADPDGHRLRVFKPG